jgi:hypothetical protein
MRASKTAAAPKEFVRPRNAPAVQMRRPETMEEYAAIGVDLIEVTRQADDPGSWMALLDHG